MPDKIASASRANTQATFLLGTGFTFLFSDQHQYSASHPRIDGSPRCKTGR
jgi:hypothetical protein